MWGNNQSIVNALQKTEPEAMDVENTEAATAVAPSS